MSCDSDGGTVEEVLEEISKKVGDGDFSNKDVEAAYSTVVKIATNILNNPQDPKYRTLKKSNPLLQQKVLIDGHHGVFCRLLITMGFSEVEDDFIFLSDDEESLDRLELHSDLLVGVSTSLQPTCVSSCTATPPTDPTNCDNTSISDRDSMSRPGPPPTQGPTPACPSRPVTPPPRSGNKPTTEQKTFRRRDDPHSKATEAMQELRAEQARRYRQAASGPQESYLGFGNPSSSQQHAPQTSHAAPGSHHTTSSSSNSGGGGGGGGIAGFFSGLFGSSSRPSSSSGSGDSSSSSSAVTRGSRTSSNPFRRRSQDGGGLRMKTLKDIQPPPPPRGGG
eukprot:GHVQ01007678.1.p1 GENE.GHVQ01007678.1~~GHVQ01007678.1.p1  ORF type:complete len:335 (+),score=83.45 GHVQ01007678.1:241-1245(+)